MHGSRLDLQSRFRACRGGARHASHLLNALLPPLLPRSPQGLGKALVEGMTRTLLRRDITNITLFADAQGKQQGLRLCTQCTCHACLPIHD